MRNQRRAGILLGYVNIIIKNIVNLLYTPLLLSYVGQSDYGVFQTANSFVYSLTLLSFGFSGTYVRFYMQRKVRDDDAGIRTLNGMYLLLYVAISTTAVVAGLVFAAHAQMLFNKSFQPREVLLASHIMRVMTFNIAVVLLSTVFDAYIASHEEFSFQQTRQMATTLMTPGLAVVLLNRGMGALGVACAQLAVSLVLLVFNMRFAIGKLKMRFDFLHLDHRLLVALVAFSSWLFANQVCDLVNQNVPNVLLGATCGASAVAVFAVSVQVRNVFVSLSTTISSVFVPLVNRIVTQSDDNMELTRLMTHVGRLQMMLLCWVYGGFVVVGKFFVQRWAGESFSDAYLLVLVMVLPLCVPLSQNVGIEIQRAKNLHRARSIVYLVMAALAVVFTWQLSSRFGYWAAAGSYVLSIVLGNGAFMNWYYHTRVGLDMGYYWRHVAFVLVCMTMAVGICCIGTRFVPVTHWVRFAGWGSAYSLLYGLFLWAVVLTGGERVSITSHISGLVCRARRGASR